MKTNIMMCNCRRPSGLKTLVAASLAAAFSACPSSGRSDAKQEIAAERRGKKIRYREYPGVRHDAWTPTFTNPKVFEWLFAQRRGKPDPTDEEPQPQTNGQSHP